jgi:hypothetical protein
MRPSARPPLAVLLIACLAACDGEQGTAPIAAQPDPDRTCRGGGSTLEVEEEQTPDVECPEGERQLLCFGSWAAHCDARGRLADLTNCRDDDQVCAAHKCDDADDCTGCRDCVPGSARCGDEGQRYECNEAGTDYEMVEVCDEAGGEFCGVATGTCEDLCARAEQEQSYIGCEYWAVPLSNAQLDFASIDADGLCRPFSFAIVVANPQGIDAHVTVDSPGLGSTTHTVRPGRTRTIELPCHPGLKGGVMDAPSLDPEDVLRSLDAEPWSLRVPDAAHHVTSDVPVTVYQFNPLEFQAEWPGTDERVYSHTNDASLLLPVHSLTGNYVVMSVPTLFNQINPPESLRDEDPVELSGPGFMAIIGVEDEPVEVEITASGWTMPSIDAEFPMLGPGDTHRFSIARGEVVQLMSQRPDRCVGEPSDPAGRGATFTYCEVPGDFDLTGTRIRAEGKVSVISGHDCAFIPHDRWACDHIEETMFPVEAWGRDIVIGISQSAECQPDIPNMVRVVSDTDGNRVHFVPEVHEPVELDAGEYVDVEILQDVRVSGSDAIMVAQFLLGQDYKGIGSAGNAAMGDPALSLGIPFEQWRSDYSFLTPETFTENYVNVIAGERQLVLLDEHAVSGFVPLEGTNLQVARVRVDGGQHRIHSQENFGIVVYGYALYTSYMVPGGLDLNLINRPD